VLFSGNGLSLEPRAFVHLGFAVTSLDVAPIACDLLQHFTFEGLLHDFFPVYTERETGGRVVDPELARQRTEREHVPGGSLEVVNAAFLDYEPDEPFDALFNIDAFQGFAPDTQRRLARRFYDWLSPGGFCLIQTRNVDGERREHLEAAFTDAGFCLSDPSSRAVWQRQSSVPPRERDRDELKLAADQDEAGLRARLDSGEKVVSFIHGSG
jgi:hypothetical protein